jgi:HrpA-like RNA helicase
LKQLYLLSAINENGKITELGLEMSRFPLEPAYSKALISSILLKCDEEMLTVIYFIPGAFHIFSKIIAGIHVIFGEYMD